MYQNSSRDFLQKSMLIFVIEVSENQTFYCLICIIWDRHYTSLDLEKELKKTSIRLSPPSMIGFKTVCDFELFPHPKFPCHISVSFDKSDSPFSVVFGWSSNDCLLCTFSKEIIFPCRSEIVSSSSCHRQNVGIYVPKCQERFSRIKVSLFVHLDTYDSILLQ